MQQSLSHTEMVDPDVTDEQNEPVHVPDHHGHTVASGYGSQPAKVPPLHGQDQNYQLRLVENLNMYSNQKAGGFFEPIIKRSSLYCPLCAGGSTCLGGG